jgi:membrane-bound lytic murein transglycosylase A
MGVPVTQLRSAAVDPKFTPLGAPIWVELRGKYPVTRLMIAQDVGAAIKGAQRADLFFGSGETAGFHAGKINAGGRMVVLIPRAAAMALAGR